MKYLITLFLCLVLAAPVSGGWWAIGETVAVGGAVTDCSDVTFLFTAEENDTVGTYDFTGTHDCTQGSDTGGEFRSSTADMTISDTAPLYGSYSLQSLQEYSNFRFVPDGNDITSVEGSFSMTFMIGTLPTAYRSVFGTAGNEPMLLQVDNNGALRISWAGAVYAVSANGVISIDTLYNIVARWDTIGDTLSLEVNGSQVGSSTSAISQTGEWTTFDVGGAGFITDFQIDNFIISSAYNKDFSSFYTITTNPCSGAGSLCQ